jgi:hypothetical protein
MSIKSKTTTGVEVVLTGEEHHGRPTVLVEFSHPKLGRVSFHSADFGERQGQHGIIGYHSRSNQRVCVTVPRADFDAALADAKAAAGELALARKKAAEEELAALKGGEKKIQLRYVDGEYLSGYTVSAPASGLLRELGLSEDVSGWGVHVSDQLVNAVGEEFTYQQAVEFARPALEAKAAKRAAKDAERADKFAEARQSGRPVELRRWSEDCCERDFDCSLDIVTEYALPDGTTKRERVHAH